MVETLFSAVPALVFDGFTTAERDALDSPQERHVIFNTTTLDLEIHLSGVWYPFLRLDANGQITAAQHGSIATAYLRRDVSGDLDAAWRIGEGGSLHTTKGNPPVGEIGGQVKTTTGAPTHSASPSTVCLVLPDSTYYVSTGGMTWVRLGGSAELAHVLTFPYPERELAVGVFMPLPGYRLLTKLTGPGVEGDQRFTVTADVAGSGTNTVLLESTTGDPFTTSPSWTTRATMALGTTKFVTVSTFSGWVWDPDTEYLRARATAVGATRPMEPLCYFEWNP